MPSFQPYHDVPGIEEDDAYLFADSFAAAPQYVRPSPQWLSIDPTLVAVHSREDHTSSAHMWNVQQRLLDLEKMASGYGHLSPLQIPEEEFSRLGFESPWASQPDIFRHMRYASPSGAFGSNFSATDSSSSDDTYSPDVSRHHAVVCGMASAPHHVFPSPAIEISYTGSNGSWTPQTLYSNHPSSSPYASSDHSACNLKDLQYAPDTTLEDERPLASGSHSTGLRLPDPEELALSAETSSFADEGLGTSINDETSTKDEEEDLEQSSDVDSDYSPGKRSLRRSSMHTRRPGMRGSPRHARTIQANTSAVLGAEFKVTKPAHRRTASANSAKAGLTSPNKVSKKSSKEFPCTFSTYGCPAIFASKNEWKRHVASQHVQLGYYRCDVGFCNPSHSGARGRGYNDFNRKDLFTQHHRRMHWTYSGKYEEGTATQKEEFEASMDAVRTRCWVVKRATPARSGCGVCGRIFEEEAGGIGTAWDERMEHVGKHFERGLSEGVEIGEDEDLTEWAIAEGLVVDLGLGGRWLVGHEPATEGAAGSGSGRRSRRRRGRGSVAQEDDDDDDEDE